MKLTAFFLTAAFLTLSSAVQADGITTAAQDAAAAAILRSLIPSNQSITANEHQLNAFSRIPAVAPAAVQGATVGTAIGAAGVVTGQLNLKNNEAYKAGTQLFVAGALAGAVLGYAVMTYVDFLEGGDVLGKVWVDKKNAASATDAENWVVNDTLKRLHSAAEQAGMKVECEDDCVPKYRGLQQIGKRYLKFSNEKESWWMTWIVGKFVESWPDEGRDQALGFAPGYETEGLGSWRIRLEGRALGLVPFPLKGAWKESPWEGIMHQLTQESSYVYLAPGSEVVFLHGRKIVPTTDGFVGVENVSMKQFVSH